MTCYRTTACLVLKVYLLRAYFKQETMKEESTLAQDRLTPWQVEIIFVLQYIYVVYSLLSLSLSINVMKRCCLVRNSDRVVFTGVWFWCFDTVPPKLNQTIIAKCTYFLKENMTSLIVSKTCKLSAYIGICSIDLSIAIIIFYRSVIYRVMRSRTPVAFWYLYQWLYYISDICPKWLLEKCKECKV